MRFNKQKARLSPKRFLSLLLIIAVAIPNVFAFTKDIKVRASDYISLSAATDTPVLNPGDLVKVKVNANHVPNLTSFDEVRLEYDAEIVTPEDVSIGPNVPASFVLTTEYGEGSITVSGIDSSGEELAAGNVDPGEIDAEAGIFSSDSEETLFEASFRIRSDATGGDIRFWISTATGFRCGSEEDYNVYISNGTTVTVEETISSDATLTQLKLNETSLSPDFRSDILEYTASVGKDVTEVNITAVPENTGAAVTIYGGNELQYGENIIRVDVVAQDGVTSLQYRIILTRQQDYIPENAMLADKDGKVYNCVDIPSSLILPDNFYETTIQIGEITVPAFQTSGLSSYLLYLYDGETAPGLYWYNPQKMTVVAYEMNNTAILPGIVLMSRKVPSTVEIPEGFTESSLELNGQSYTGYSDSNGTFICYMVDEDNYGRFYSYNPDTGSFSGYTPRQKNNEGIFKLLFYFFVTISIIESVMIIFIVLTLRRIKNERVNPRPKRV